MTTRRLFLAKLAGLAGFTLLSKAKGDYTKPLSLPVVVWRKAADPEAEQKRVFDAVPTNIDYDRLLYCISAVETQHQDTVVGPNGERSRYQMKLSVWKQHVGPWPRIMRSGEGAEREFARNCRFLAHPIAWNHLTWLNKELGQLASVYSLAWCWKEGLEAYRQAHSNRSGMSFSVKSALRGHRYGRRVANLYNDPTYQHT